MNSEDQQRGETPDPNSEKGSCEAVGVREASGETLVKPVCQPSELLGQGEDKSKLRVEVEERRLTSATSNTQTLKHSNNSSRCGFWVSNDPETLAKTLCEAMSLSDAERRQMGEIGREWIRRDFSWEGVGAKMKAAYEWLLDGGTRPDFVKEN